MPCCAAVNCSRKEGKEEREKGFTFHRFPYNEPERLKKWLVNMGRGSFRPSSRALVCSAHFEDSCFYRFGLHTRLKEDAVPTVFDFKNAVKTAFPGKRSVAGVRCAAWSCGNHPEKGSGRSFHQFPKDPTRQEEWVKALGRKGFQATAYSRICSDHFEESCFDRTGQVTRLKENATPSLFNFLQPLQKDGRPRKGPSAGNAGGSGPCEVPAVTVIPGASAADSCPAGTSVQGTKVNPEDTGEDNTDLYSRETDDERTEAHRTEAVEGMKRGCGSKGPKTDNTKTWRKVSEARPQAEVGSGQGSRGQEFGSRPVHSPAYLHWKRLGAQQGLHEDRDIACFLLKYYEHTSRVLPAGLTGVCRTCGTPLSVSCTRCDWSICADAAACTSPHHQTLAGNTTEQGETERRGGDDKEGDSGVNLDGCYVRQTSDGSAGTEDECDGAFLSEDHPQDVKPDISLLVAQLSDNGNETGRGGLSLDHNADDDDDDEGNSCSGFDDGGDEWGEMPSIVLDVAIEPEVCGVVKTEEDCETSSGSSAEDGGLTEEGMEEDEGREEEEVVGQKEDEKGASDILAVENSTIEDLQSSQVCFVVNANDGTGEAFSLEDTPVINGASNINKNLRGLQDQCVVSSGTVGDEQTAQMCFVVHANDGTGEVLNLQDTDNPHNITDASDIDENHTDLHHCIEPAVSVSDDQTTVLALEDLGESGDSQVYLMIEVSEETGEAIDLNNLDDGLKDRLLQWSRSKANIDDCDMDIVWACGGAQGTEGVSLGETSATDDADPSHLDHESGAGVLNIQSSFLDQVIEESVDHRHVMNPLQDTAEELSSPVQDIAGEPSSPADSQAVAQRSPQGHITEASEGEAATSATKDTEHLLSYPPDQAGDGEGRGGGQTLDEGELFRRCFLDHELLFEHMVEFTAINFTLSAGRLMEIGNL
ncbi:hypothetical protein ACOMHN_050518 [Nucella lapillus]